MQVDCGSPFNLLSLVEFQVLNLNLDNDLEQLLNFHDLHFFSFKMEAMDTLYPVVNRIKWFVTWKEPSPGSGTG